MEIDVKGLPEEVTRELRFSERAQDLPSPTQTRIKQALKKLGQATYNELIVEIFKQDGTVVTRVSVASTMRLLALRGEVHRIKAGLYSLVPGAEKIPPRARGKKPASERKCEQCDRPLGYSGLRFHGKSFCTPACVRDYRVARGGACKCCGKVLTGPPHTFNRRKFCSQKCITRWQTR